MFRTWVLRGYFGVHRRGATLSNEAVPNACRHNPIDLMSAQGCEQEKAEEQTWKAERK